MIMNGFFFRQLLQSLRPSGEDDELDCGRMGREPGKDRRGTCQTADLATGISEWSSTQMNLMQVAYGLEWPDIICYKRVDPAKMSILVSWPADERLSFLQGEHHP